MQDRKTTKGVYLVQEVLRSQRALLAKEQEAVQAMRPLALVDFLGLQPAKVLVMQATQDEFCLVDSADFA